MGLGGGWPRRWSALLITSYQGCRLSMWPITVAVDLDHLAEANFIFKQLQSAPLLGSIITILNQLGVNEDNACIAHVYTGMKPRLRAHPCNHIFAQYFRCFCDMIPGNQLLGCEGQASFKFCQILPNYHQETVFPCIHPLTGASFPHLPQQQSFRLFHLCQCREGQGGDK